MMNPEGLAEGKPHMIDFVELASLGCKLYLFVFVIVVNHVGFMVLKFTWFLRIISYNE